MTLNKEDFAILQGNVRQIENYLRSLMPEIQETIIVRFGDMVTSGCGLHLPESKYTLFVGVDFGDTVRRDAGYGLRVPEIEYRLLLGKDTLLGRQGFLTYEFTSDGKETSSSVSVYSRGHGEQFMQKLVRDWPKIKEKILTILGGQQRKLDEIRNFKL